MFYLPDVLIKEILTFSGIEEIIKMQDYYPELVDNIPLIEMSRHDKRSFETVIGTLKKYENNINTNTKDFLTEYKLRLAKINNKIKNINLLIEEKEKEEYTEIDVNVSIALERIHRYNFNKIKNVQEFGDKINTVFRDSDLLDKPCEYHDCMYEDDVYIYSDIDPETKSIECGLDPTTNRYHTTKYNDEYDEYYEYDCTKIICNVLAQIDGIYDIRPNDGQVFFKWKSLINH